jgi:hypothetical protein
METGWHPSVSGGKFLSKLQPMQKKMIAVQVTVQVAVTSIT